MSGINLILIFLAMFGCLPLFIIWYRRKRVQKLSNDGLSTQGHIHTTSRLPRSAATIFYYSYYAIDGKQYSGSLTADSGKFKTGDTLEVFYMPGKPAKSTVKAAWQSKGLLIFGILLAIFTWFAAYKLYEMVRNGEL
ncbi:MAG: DUF3592 domain-containing protein [Bacteroidota bacterium]